MVLPGCVIFLFYIKPQLVGRFDGGRVSCVIFLFYIKPQPAKHLPAKRGSCVIFLFYIKPQPDPTDNPSAQSCVIFLFYIKPQPCCPMPTSALVVLYFYSTSNHNQMMDRFYPNRVVLYFYSTSNHNSHEYTNKMHELCYISILHQTTTRPSAAAIHSLLCYISILHQTTTPSRCAETPSKLCYISILHQTTTITQRATHCESCVIFLFYIKPQLRAGYRLIMRRLCCKSVARKCACAIRRSGNDAIISILFANVSKKFQLLRHVGLFPFDLAPEIANLAVLLVRDAQHAGVPRRRHRFAYPFDMYRHILLGCAMSYINRVLHHGKTVFLQRLAKQSRMTSLGLCIGRQVEEYE